MKVTKICWSSLVTTLIIVSLCYGAPPNHRQVVEMKEDVAKAQEQINDQQQPKNDLKEDVTKAQEEIKVHHQPEKVLKVDEIEPQDHLDAVRLEQDGMINKEYKKEIFIGEHEEIDHEESNIAESKLKDIFSKIDADQDYKICTPEIESWILDKTQQHFDQAVEENNKIFHHMDPDGNGLVHWKEYYVHFLLAQGYPLDRANKHVVDYDEIELGYQPREDIIRYKFKWTDADIDPMDNQLNVKEFLAFRHPEQSDIALDNMIKTIVDSLDRNDDDILTEEEFVSLPLGEIDDEEQKKLDKEWQKERQVEFREHMDLDHDGSVTKQELKKYIDPRNPDQAKTDTRNLLKDMDDNGDECLSWKEIINHKDIFISSKVINIKKVLHDEF